MRIISVTPRARAEARFVLRVIAGDAKPAVAKIGERWYAYDGMGSVRPYRSWRGALRALRPLGP